MGSGPGIASMILGIIASIFVWILFPVLIIMGLGSANLGLAVLGIFAGFLGIILAVVGLILGIVGVASDEKKVYSIIGLILCAIILFFTASLFLR